MVVTIREAVPEDAADIAQAHVRGWQVAYAGIVPQPFLDAMDLAARTEHWRQILRGEVPVEGVDFPANYAALVDDRVVGFANVGECRSEPSPAVGELWAMYVHPEYWDVGAGFALMGATFDHLRSMGCERAHLWVLEANDRARRFYERQGWICDDEVKEEQLRDFVLVERRYSIEL